MEAITVTSRDVTVQRRAQQREQARQAAIRRTGRRLVTGQNRRAGWPRKNR